MSKLIFKLIIGFLIVGYCLILTQNIYAATYYMSPTGNDSNNGLSQSAPFATFAKAFPVMASGDTLYVMDGVYNQQIIGMPSGTPGNYTKIYALNDHKAEIDGQGILPSVGWQGLLYISGKSYVEVRGLRIHNSSATNHVCAIESSSNINIKVTACWQAGTYKHDTPVNISGGSSNILLEDVWVFGRGRYSVLVFSSNNVTLRRIITRWDSGAYAGEPNAGVSIYNSSNNIIENNITLDHNAQNIQPDHSGFYLPANVSHSDNNGFYGNIALNLPKTITGTQYGAKGFYLDPSSAQGDINNIFINNVAFKTDFGMMLGGTTTQNTQLKNNTFGQNYNDGIYNGGGVIGTVVKNTSLYKNGGVGVNNTGSITLAYNGAFQNVNGAYSGLTCSPVCVTTDPSLLYFPRIEAASPYIGAGEGGMDNIGATVVKRYQDGVLTTTNLWPWPYEDWIKQDMCTSVGETRGFCSKTSLTEYIWSYLGNPNPYSNGTSTQPAPPKNLMVK